MDSAEYKYLALNKVLGGFRDEYINELIKKKDYWRNKLQNYIIELQKYNIADECHNCNDIIIFENSNHFTCDDCGEIFHYRCKQNDNYNGEFICGQCKMKFCQHYVSYCIRCLDDSLHYIDKCHFHENTHSHEDQDPCMDCRYIESRICNVCYNKL